MELNSPLNKSMSLEVQLELLTSSYSDILPICAAEKVHVNKAETLSAENNCTTVMKKQLKLGCMAVRFEYEYQRVYHISATKQCTIAAKCSHFKGGEGTLLICENVCS